MSQWHKTLILTFTNFPVSLLVPDGNQFKVQGTFPCALSWLHNTHSNTLSIAKASSDVTLCDRLWAYFTAVGPLALQKIVGGAGRDDVFGVEVEFVADASLEQMHKTCWDTSECADHLNEGVLWQSKSALESPRVDSQSCATFIEDSRIYGRGDPWPLLLHGLWWSLHTVVLLIVPSWKKTEWTTVRLDARSMCSI